MIQCQYVSYDLIMYWFAMSESVGDRLERARKEKGLSREQVSQRLGISLSTVQAQENGRNQLRPDSLIDYARLYGVSIDWLVTGKESQSAEVIEIYKAIPNQRERDAWINMGKALREDKA